MILDAQHKTWLDFFSFVFHFSLVSLCFSSFKVQFFAIVRTQTTQLLQFIILFYFFFLVLFAFQQWPVLCVCVSLCGISFVIKNCVKVFHCAFWPIAQKIRLVYCSHTLIVYTFTYALAFSLGQHSIEFLYECLLLQFIYFVSIYNVLSSCLLFTLIHFVFFFTSFYI